jgi:DNA-binding NtrC family response regulator
MPPRKNTTGESAKEIIGKSAAACRLRDMIDAAAPVDTVVLLAGPVGSGRELAARRLHALGPRAGKPFITIPCAALSVTLAESELFGHERGAFTGADKRREGRFEQAAGGTMFLDEIGDMPLSAQAKVLRLLEERTFERVGGSGSVTADVRLITATHHDLREEIERSQFREDLYYRIRVVELIVPPLRDRGADILFLAGRFAQEFSTRYDKGIVGFSDEAIETIGAYAWPGNVRELRNAVETGVVLSGGERIGLAELPDEIRGGGGVPVAAPGGKWEPLRDASKRSQEQFDRAYISRALKESEGNTSAAARLLGMYRQTLQNKMRALGMSAEDFRAPS